MAVRKLFLLSDFAIKTGAQHENSSVHWKCGKLQENSGFVTEPLIQNQYSVVNSIVCIWVISHSEQREFGSESSKFWH